MTIKVVCEYHSEPGTQSLVEVYLVSEEAFVIGGYTLRTKLQYSNKIDQSIHINSITTSELFFTSNNIESGISSGISISNTGTSSQARSGLENHWVKLASYTLTDPPVDDINTFIEINPGDFFSESGENITVAYDEQILKTQAGNAEGSVSLQGELIQGSTLNAIHTLSDPEGLGDFQYTWYRKHESSETWEKIETPNQESYSLTQVDVGHYLKVSIGYTDGSGNEELKSSTISTNNVQNIDDPASAQVVITGSPQEGATLNASLQNFSDPDGSLLSTSVQWQKQLPNNTWTNLAGQNSPSLQIPDDQSFVGFTLRALLTSTDSNNGTSDFHSQPLYIQNVDDAPTGIIQIRGLPMEGQILEAVDNIEDADGISNIAYSWIIGGEIQPQSNAKKYELKQATSLRTISAKVTATLTDTYGNEKKIESQTIQTSTIETTISNTEQPKEGEAAFLTNIAVNTENEHYSNLAEGATIWWAISGITEDDLATGSLTGSGKITDGKLVLSHSLATDSDSGEAFEVSVFSNEERTSQIGEMFSVGIQENPNALFDANNDGLVDNTANYKIFDNNSAIDLKWKSGSTISEKATAPWKAIAAAKNDSGYQVLLTGQTTNQGRFYVYDTSPTGVINSGSGWKSRQQAIDLGWDDDFNIALGIEIIN